MKSIFGVIAAILLTAAITRADVVDDGLGDRATLQVRTSTREMIRLGIPEEDAIGLTRQMIRNQYPEQEVLAAHQVIREMVREGLPGKPAMDKAHEGMAKQAGPQNTVRAMEQVRTRYSFAYAQAAQVTGQTSARAELGDTIAEGMAAGMAEGHVAAVTLRLQARQKTMTRDQIHQLARQSFMAAREMARRGAGGSAASGVVCQALERSWGAQDMERLRLTFMNQARLGNPTGLAARYENQIRNGMTADGLGRQGAGSGYQGSMGGQGQQGGGSPSRDGSGSGSGGSSGGGSGSGGSGSGSSGGGSGSGSGGSGSGRGGRGGN
jgi:hypothetical protein